MKTKLIEIIMASGKTDEEKAKEIIAQAIVKGGPPLDDADEQGDKLLALRDVLEIIGRCNPFEVMITPKLFILLALELERRGQNAARAETKAIFHSD